MHLGGLGFGFKWNMGWMHDILEYLHHEPVHRKYHHSELTFGLLYAWTENFVLPLSHDEVVYGKGSLSRKMPGDEWQRFANLRLLYAFMWALPGQEAALHGRRVRRSPTSGTTTAARLAADGRGPFHRGVQRLVQDLNRIYRNEPSLYEIDFEPAGFQWIDCSDWEQSVITFCRFSRNRERLLLCACNFTPVSRTGYRVGVPRAGYYREILNTDAALYGGGDRATRAGSRASPAVARPAALGGADIPPLASVWLVPA